MAAVLQLLLKRALDAMVTQCVTLNSCNCRADERILFDLTGCEVNVVRIFSLFHVSIYSAPITLRFFILAMAELITYTGCHTIAKSWCGPWPHGLLSHGMVYTLPRSLHMNRIHAITATRLHSSAPSKSLLLYSFA